MKNLANAAPAPAIDNDGYTVGAPVGAAVQGQRLPSIPQRAHPFMLGHHPRSWELVKTTKGWRLLPTVKTLVALPGCNWVEAGKGGKLPDTSRMRARFEDQGWKVFGDMGEYLLAIPAAGGSAYFTKFEKVKTYPDGDWEKSFDDKGWDAWRTELVTSGRISPPRDSVVNRIRAQLQRQIQRADRQQHLPVAQRARKEAEARLEGLDRALTNLKKDLQPKPQQEDADA